MGEEFEACTAAFARYMLAIKQACTTYGPWATCSPRVLFLQPTGAFSIAENVAKVRFGIINNRTNSSLSASFWGICLLVPA